ncbi:TonB-dependent receptor [Hoylesella oralis]|uniref:SusC/RagA family TonB-linked outer membrane protein n=1 Tax=Hoylesella oralis TaxID=28134 RepID=UPI0028E54D37|nr:TonB-dependent receptor [Hoylesella oralis]
MTKEETKLKKAIRSSLLFLSACAFVHAVPAYATGGGSKLLATSQVAQQANNVTVTVVDQNNEPIIGASVLVVSTKEGGATNADGQCTIHANPGDKLQISYIGYTPQTVTVGNSPAMVITLGEDRAMLDEVVVVGYGTMRKSDVTGSIAVAKGSDMLKAQNFSALDNLRGKASGVNVFSNSDQPGVSAPRVIIRGMATINASTSPLYVVDGVVMNNFALVNPNDIESMEVLKDASATAIYGARGANGVIMVTTKRGLKGAEGTKVSYQGSISLRHIARKMDVLNAQEWCDAFMKGLENENTYQGKNWSLDRTYWFRDTRYFDSNGNPLYNTDWQDEATRTSVSHNHQINIQQAGKTSSVGAFLNYSDYQGIMLNTWSKRVSGKLAYDANPTNWLTTNVNLMVNHMWSRYTDETSGGQEARRTMIEMLPWLPVRDTNGNYTTSTSPSQMSELFGFEGMSNPVMILDLQKRLYYNTQMFGNAAFTFHLLQGLDLKTQLGLDWHNIELRRYASRDLNNIAQSDQGIAENDRYRNLYWQEETYLTYNRTLNKLHRLNGMFGMSWQGYTSRRNYSETKGFDDDFFEDNNMGAGKVPSPPDSNFDEWYMNSYFLRLAYTYNDRYSATLTGRVDGSSKFGKDNQYAFFPSAGLAWIASEENFLKDVSWLSNLKLHTSYGLTGNSEIGTYRSLARLSVGTLLLNDARSSYAYLSSMPNPNLKWEKTGQFDIGFELGLLNNALNFDISYYYKKTTDLLLDCPVPHSTGFQSIYKNIGSVKNSGLDIMINAYPIRSKDFTWNSTLNLNYNKNKILHLGDNDEDIEILGWVGGSEGILRVGESMGSFYGYERYGIWTKEDYAAGKCNLNQVGRPHRSDSKTILGKGIPDWTGSWTNTFNYKNWDLTLDMQFVMGVETMQQFYHPTYDRFGITNGLTSVLYDAYNGSNPGTMEQMIYLCNSGHAGQDTTVDSSWICDGSYLRCNMLQLGYTFTPTAMKSIGLNALRLYVSANNLFLICSKDFKGYDPESTSQSSKFGQNMTFYSYPRARTFTLGVNVTF